MLVCRASACEKYHNTLSTIQETDLRNRSSDSLDQYRSHGVRFDTAGEQDHSLSTLHSRCTAIPDWFIFDLLHSSKYWPGTDLRRLSVILSATDLSQER